MSDENFDGVGRNPEMDQAESEIATLREALAKAREEVAVERRDNAAMAKVNAELSARALAAEREVERLTKEREAMHARFLDWRGVEESDACQTCDGAGSRTYASTAVWRGGIGGQALTRAVCDKCWGSGSKSRPWLSHRQALAAFEAERAAERARDGAARNFESLSIRYASLDKSRRDLLAQRDEAVAALRGVADFRPLPSQPESLWCWCGCAAMPKTHFPFCLAARRALAASTGEAK